MNNKRVLLGMSGGVDSTASAILLQKAGYEVIGLTFVLTDDKNFNLSIADAKRAADILGIKHIVADYKEVFEKSVIKNFVDEYALGRTPNPCVVCNKTIKFGQFLKTADELDAHYVASGQYAKVINKNGTDYLSKPASVKKDQTYFLYTLKENILNRILFPMSEIESKDDTRSIVRDAGIETFSRKDSQEICFIKDCDYAEYITSKIGKKMPKGNFIDKNGKILGIHDGILNYTIGQRKGLGIALGKPVFVTNIDVTANTVTLGENEDLFSKELNIYDYNFINREYDRDVNELTAKIRYAAKEEPAIVIKQNDYLHIEFKNPVRAVTKGQSVVLYDNDILVGGGIIG